MPIKKNLLFFHLDSLMYDGIVDKPERPCPMPFLRSLMDKGLCTTNLYSKAPYTEAAVMSLYAGYDTMSHGGYMEKFRYTPDFLFRRLHDAGYETFTIGQAYGFSAVENLGFDVYYYAIPHDFHALWPYRLDYFQGLHRRGELTAADAAQLARMVDSNMREYRVLLEHMTAEDASTALIRGNCSTADEAPEALRTISAEYVRFQQAPRPYLEELLEQGYAHPLLKLPRFTLDRKVKQPATQTFVQENFGPFLAESYAFNRRCNRRNNPPSLRVLGDHLRRIGFPPRKDAVKDVLRYGKNVLESRHDHDLLCRAQPGYAGRKTVLPIRTHFRTFLDWLEGAHNGVQPFAALLTLDDIHNEEMFFTYDSDDTVLLGRELAQLKAFRSRLSDNYKGSLSYDYAMVYLDNCLRDIYAELEQRGLLETTCVVFTADHGFSFAYNPPRATTVINYFTENYHVPFLLLDPDVSPQTVTEYRSNSDVAPTVLDVLGLPKPDSYVGTSLRQTGVSPGYVTMEYMGAGCPDMERRPVQMAIRSAHWNVVVHAMVTRPFAESRLLEVYDLRNDPQELHNLAHRPLPADVQTLLSALQARFEALQQDYAAHKAALAAK